MISYDSREMFLSKLSHLSRKRRPDKLIFKPKEKVNIIYIKKSTDQRLGEQGKGS